MRIDITNAALNKTTNTNLPAYGEAAKLGMDEAAAKAMSDKAMEAIRAGKAIDLNEVAEWKGPEITDTYDPYEGKTVIDNRASCGLIVETIDPSVITPYDANKSAAAGGATHGFFYHETDFLFDAAKEYAELGENEVYRFRNIHDVNFVRDTLDFFTNGNYTQSDVNAMQEQMTEIVYELAQQIKDGGSADLSKVQTQLTVGGQDVSLTQLLEMQKVGKELSESFDGFSWGSLNGKNTQAFAEMGIAKAVGNYYGSDKGEIGTMFSDAIDRLYEKGVTLVEKGEAWAQYVEGGSTASDRDAVKLELNIADVFSKLDASSKSSLSSSFSSALSETRAMVQQYCSQYGLLTSYVGLAGDTDNISKFFQGWMDRV